MTQKTRSKKHATPPGMMSFGDGNDEKKMLHSPQIRSPGLRAFSLPGDKRVRMWYDGGMNPTEVSVCNSRIPSKPLPT